MLYTRPSVAAVALAALGLLSANPISAQTPSTSAGREVVHNVVTGETWVSPVPVESAHPDAGMLSLQGASTPQQVGPGGTSSLVQEAPSSPNAGGATARSPREARIQAIADVPPDFTQRIGATDQYPWSTQCKLYITYPDGTFLRRSGTLVSDKYVLTAGECVYDSDFGGWADTIEVVPGLNGGSRPFGSAFATYMRSYTGWTDNRYLDHDFGLITLDRAIGNSTGWLGYEWNSSFNGWTCNISGYPNDVDNGERQWYSYGDVWAESDNLLRVPTFSQSPGMIGACGYHYDSSQNQRWAFGIYVGDTYATRINSTKFNSLSSWIGSGY
jgi:V8-like Glu-specific endopeptidase